MIPQNIQPQDVWQKMQQNTDCFLVDVRSSMEFLFVGHPEGAVSIPWIDEPDWDINPNFTKEIRQLLLGGGSGDKQPDVFLICRSGKRSHEAGILLLQNGIKNVFNVEGGFEGERDHNARRSTINGWRFAGLPWQQC